MHLRTAVAFTKEDSHFLPLMIRQMLINIIGVGQSWFVHGQTEQLKFLFTWLIIWPYFFFKLIHTFEFKCYTITWERFRPHFTAQAEIIDAMINIPTHAYVYFLIFRFPFGVWPVVKTQMQIRKVKKYLDRNTYLLYNEGYAASSHQYIKIINKNEP